MPVRVLEAVDSVHLGPESDAGEAGGAIGALAFLPSSVGAVMGSDDGAQAAQPAFDRLLVRALLRAPADLGWQPVTMRSGRLPLSPRMLALVSLVACAALGGGAWYVEREAIAAEAAARATRHEPVIAPNPPAPPEPTNGRRGLATNPTTHSRPIHLLCRSARGGYPEKT